ncbi:mucin-1 [Xenopus laevis]|nr:mucin-1 [Xenopus laevis]
MYVTMRFLTDYVTAYADANSAEYKTIENDIVQFYNKTFACSNCAKRSTYRGVTLLTLQPGSVIANTRLSFSDQETQTNVQNIIERQLSQDGNKIGGHQVSDVRTSTSPIDSATTGPPVPGWGIALLVLMSVILFIAFIFIIVMITNLCRRNNSGLMDVFSTRSSYHTMSDYTSHQTHGRYVAPNKYNAYNEAGNGTKNKFSYTNPTLETNDL